MAIGERVEAISAISLSRLPIRIGVATGNESLAVIDARRSEGARASRPVIKP
jgi:hypothetical protein